VTNLVYEILQKETDRIVYILGLGVKSPICSMTRFFDAIKVLIAANIILYVITFLMPGMETFMFEKFALYFPKNEKFSFWQLITNMFMHGGFTHLLFNMYALWAFGSPLEEMWGRNKFLVFYFVSGIGAGVIYTLVNYFQFNTIYQELISAGVSPAEILSLLETGKYGTTSLSSISETRLVDFYRLFNTPAVGASGAIYGILVAFGITYPNAKLALIFFPVPIAAKYFIPVLIGLDLFSGVTGFSIFGGGIAHFAHIGGALIGFLLMWYWRIQKERQQE
jgi:membrane associated rhomboid family serine protease